MRLDRKRARGGARTSEDERESLLFQGRRAPKAHLGRRAGSERPLAVPRPPSLLPLTLLPRPPSLPPSLSPSLPPYRPRHVRSPVQILAPTVQEQPPLPSALPSALPPVLLPLYQRGGSLLVRPVVDDGAVATHGRDGLEADRWGGERGREGERAGSR
jgi:hypothetical protein